MEMSKYFYSAKSVSADFRLVSTDAEKKGHNGDGDETVSLKVTIIPTFSPIFNVGELSWS